MDIGEQEARRADNQIWNAAGAYGFATGSRGYEPNGEASLYFNTAIGLVRQLYDYKKLELLFTALERHSRGELQSELLWLGLERCAYLRCRDARPALTFLRQDRLKIGWFRRALGLSSEESDREKQILDALEFDPDWDAEAIQTRMEQIVLKYFGRNLRNEIDHFNSNRVDLGFFARLMLAVFLFLSFVYIEQNHLKPADISSTQIVNEIQKEIPGNGMDFISRIKLY